MFQVIDPHTNDVVFEGDVKDICDFAKSSNISAHIYFDESEYLNYPKGNFIQMVGLFDCGKPYWIPFANVVVGKC